MRGDIKKTSVRFIILSLLYLIFLSFAVFGAVNKNFMDWIHIEWIHEHHLYLHIFLSFVLIIKISCLVFWGLFKKYSRKREGISEFISWWLLGDILLLIPGFTMFLKVIVEYGISWGGAGFLFFVVSIPLFSWLSLLILPLNPVSKLGCAVIGPYIQLSSFFLIPTFYADKLFTNSFVVILFVSIGISAFLLTKKINISKRQGIFSKLIATVILLFFFAINLWLNFYPVYFHHKIAKECDVNYDFCSRLDLYRLSVFKHNFKEFLDEWPENLSVLENLWVIHYDLDELDKTKLYLKKIKSLLKSQINYNLYKISHENIVSTISMISKARDKILGKKGSGFVF